MNRLMQGACVCGIVCDSAVLRARPSPTQQTRHAACALQRGLPHPPNPSCHPPPKPLQKNTDPRGAFELPDAIEDYLDEHLARRHGAALCAAFNRQGTLLAAGTAAGRVVVWDFDTRGVARVLGEPAAAGDAANTAAAAADAAATAADAALKQERGASGSPSERRRASSAGADAAAAGGSAVTALAWSRSGRKLLAGRADGRVVLYDVLLGTPVFEHSFAGAGSAVTAVSLSPRAPFTLLACLADGPPQLVDAASGAAHALPTLELKQGAGGRAADVVAAAPAPAAAVLSRDGRLVFAAQARGLVAVFDAATRRVVDLVRLPATARVLSLTLNRRGTLVLANCHDKVLRLLEAPRGAGAAATAAAAPTSRPAAGGRSRGGSTAGGGGGSGSGSGASSAAFKSYAVGPELSAALKAAGEPARAGPLLLPPESAPLRPPAAGGGAGGGGGAAAQFMNAVERTQWRGAAFSADGEHVAAAVGGRDAGHKVFVWSRAYGKLERILEGASLKRRENGGTGEMCGACTGLLRSACTAPFSPD